MSLLYIFLLACPIRLLDLVPRCRPGSCNNGKDCFVMAASASVMLTRPWWLWSCTSLLTNKNCHSTIISTTALDLTLPPRVRWLLCGWWSPSCAYPDVLVPYLKEWATFYTSGVSDVLITSEPFPYSSQYLRSTIPLWSVLTLATLRTCSKNTRSSAKIFTFVHLRNETSILAPQFDIGAISPANCARRLLPETSSNDDHDNEQIWSRHYNMHQPDEEQR